MKRLGFILAVILLSASAKAQTTVFSCTFETPAERSAWTFQNNSQGSNAWMTGTTIAADGQYSMFVSWNGGTTCSYQTNKASSLYSYTTINLTSGTHVYSYDCYVGGEAGGTDCLIAALVPSSEPIPTTTGLWTLPATAIRLHSETKLFLTGGWINKADTITVNTAGYYNLIFYWRNDAADGTSMSAAVDNIVISQVDNVPVVPDSFNVALSVSNPLHGTALGGGTYASGSAATIVAAPNYGYAFGGWSDSNNDNPRQLQVTQDSSLTALFFVSDTVYSTDTVVITDSAHYIDTVHDTVYHNLYHHDTVAIHDTTVDTIYVNLYHTDTVTRHDTVTVNYFHTDTVTVTIHDTVEYNYYHTDTIFSVDTVRDTLVFDYYHTDTVYLHDTSVVDTIIHDTIQFVRYDTVQLEVTRHDTLIFNHYDTVDRLVTVYDTIIFHDTVARIDTVLQRDTIWHIDTVVIRDTIVVHDTIEVGIDEIDLTGIKVYADVGRLVIDNPSGAEVRLYDPSGRQSGVWQQQNRIEADVPSAGIYIVRIGDRYTRKVLVIK